MPCGVPIWEDMEDDAVLSDGDGWFCGDCIKRWNEPATPERTA